MAASMINVLFVCMGNICRSPMAEGAFRQSVHHAGLEDTFNIDSAGTIGFHAGDLPDPRAIEVASRHGIDIRSQRSRKVTPDDFVHFHHIVAMDNENLRNLMDASTQEYRDKITLFLPFAPTLALDEMPDPYYGHHSQFDFCFKAATQAADGLLAHLCDRHDLS